MPSSAARATEPSQLARSRPDRAYAQGWVPYVKGLTGRGFVCLASQTTLLRPPGESGARSVAAAGWGRVGQAEEECRALAQRCFGPDLTAVASERTLHGSETHTGALEVARCVQALKRREQLTRVLHIEAGAVVAHEEGGGRRRVSAEFDSRVGLLRREFPCVAKQVHEHEAE